MSITNAVIISASETAETHGTAARSVANSHVSETRSCKLTNCFACALLPSFLAEQTITPRDASFGLNWLLLSMFSALEGRERFMSNVAAHWQTQWVHSEQSCLLASAAVH